MTRRWRDEVCFCIGFRVTGIVQVTTDQEHHLFVHKNDRWEQRFSLYIRQICFKEILKSAVLLWLRQQHNN